MLIVTPKIISDTQQAREVTEELRDQAAFPGRFAAETAHHAGSGLRPGTSSMVTPPAPPAEPSKPAEAPKK